MQTVSFAGSSYNIPKTRGDRPWSGLSDFVIAAASKAINTAGGNFTLLADINFGATFGLVSTYYKSRTANVASAGQIRLANADTIKFRNTLNNADLSVAIASNRLTFEGSRLVIAGAAEIVNADISASAAIAYSKLALTASIVNADVSASAAIAYSKLALTGSIVNADITAGTLTNAAINASAAIAYSKLALTGSIVNADLTAGTLTNTAINASAAIALTKLAALASHSRALVSDSSGFIAEATTTAAEIGFVNGVTSAIQTQINAKATGTLNSSSAGNLAYYSGSTAISGVTGPTVNAAGYVIGTVVQSILTKTTSQDSSSGADTFTATTATATIVPKATTHKIKITACSTVGGSATAGDVICLTIKRDTTDLSATTDGLVQFTNSGVGAQSPCTIIFLDSPASTGSLVYKLFIKNKTANRAAAWNNPSQQSIFLVEEIAA